MVAIVAPQRPALQSVWSNRFRNVDDVYRAGGTLIDGPSFLPEGGMVCNGSSQYAVFPLANTMAHPSITIKQRITPFFDYDYDDFVWFFGTTNDDYRLRKANNAASNELLLEIGGSTVAGNIPTSAYGPYWYTNQINTIIIAATSGSTQVYWNNHLIATSASLWSPKLETFLDIAARHNNTYHFNGVVHEFSIFPEKWTADQVDYDYNNSTFLYPNKAKIWVGMDSYDVSGTGHSTKDSSPNGYTIELGNGAGNNEPSYLYPGYKFDGAATYMQSTAASNAFNCDEISIIMALKYHDFQIGDTIFYIDTQDPQYRIYKAAANDNIYLTLNGASVGNAAYATWIQYAMPNSINVLAITAKSSDTDYYLNSHIIVEGNASVFTGAVSGKLFIGANRSLGYGYIDASVYHFSVLPFKMTAVQVRDITNRLIQRYGQ